MTEALAEVEAQRSWSPTPKQAEFLALPYDITEALYGGALMAGKSDVLLLYPIIHRLHENSQFKGVYFRRTFPELKNEVIPRSEKFFRRLGAEYNKNDKCWTFPSGALFFFGHCENEKDVHNYDTMQITYAAFDELTSFLEWQYLYITVERVRSPIGSGLPAITRSGSNPGNIGHGWVKRRFVDPCPDGMKVIRQGNNKRIFIPATIRDNPYAPEEYIQKLELLPEAEKAAKLYGKWDAYQGQVFDEFRDKHFPDEPENALHVIEPFDIPEWWPKIVSADWGYAPPAMTYINYGAISPNKRVYVYRGQRWQKTKIEDWCAQAKVHIDKEDPRFIKLCKSAGQDRGQEHTILQQVSSALGRAVELSNNSPGSRIANKQLIHEYFRWQKKIVPASTQLPFNEEYANYLLRNRTAKEYNSYLSSFRQLAEDDNLPRVQIFSGCGNELLIAAIKICEYDKINVEDVAEFPGDDPYDSFRYLIDGADRYFDEATTEFTKIQQKDNLERRLEETGDWNNYYRNARRLEETEKVTIMNRYSRRGAYR